MHGFRVSAVLAADAELERRTGLAALFRGELDESADAVPVEGLERGDAEDATVQVRGEERRLDVVAGEAPGRLREVVGAEGEELGCLGDLSGGQRGARQFDHRADQSPDVCSGGLGY